jgi:amino acid adenylation domain-containing protein
MNPMTPQPEPTRDSQGQGDTGEAGDIWLSPSSYAQRRLYFLALLDPDSPAYNIPITLRLKGRVDPDALERAVNRIVQRHEALRTIFALRDGELMQVIAPTLHVPLSRIDLRLLGPDEREAGWRRVAAEEGARLFDLASGPLLRVAFVILGPLDSVLQITVHHIVFDGWSTGVFVRELAEFYSADLERREPALPELPIQYADFASFQKERALDADHEVELQHWKEALAGAKTSLELPTDRPRPPTQTARGGLEVAPLSAPRWSAVAEFSRKVSATPFMTMLAAFGAVLHRWSGQDDLLVGCPAVGRDRPELEGLIGFFVNTFVVRIDASGDPTFRELVGRVRAACRTAYAHQDSPFDRLVETINPERTRDRHPIFQVMFALDPPDSRLTFAGIELERVVVHNGTSKCDLMLEGAAGTEGAILYLEYSRDLFDAPGMAALLQRFRRVLNAAVSDPDKRLSELPMIGAEERTQLLLHATGQAAVYPRDESVAILFEAQVRQTPDAIAATCDGQQLSYADLNRRANQLARYLTSRGVGPGVLVGVALDRSLDLLVALVGIAKSGGAYVPLDLAYPRDRVVFMLSDSGTSLVVTGRQFVAAIPAPSTVCLDDESLGLSLLPDDDLPAQAHGGDLIYVMYTSGSTGQPKGVAVAHRGVGRLVRGTTYVRWSDVRALLHMAPASFDASTFEIWGALLNGARSVLISDRLVSLEVLEGTLRSEGVDCLWLTAALFNTVIDVRPGMLAGVRQLIVGGEALSVGHVRRALALLPDTQLVNGYGPTETTTFACTYQIPRVLDADIRSIPIGQPIANTQAYVLDRYGSLVPTGVAGELYLGGDGLAREYLRAPALTAERFVADTISGLPNGRLYRTGDLARWRADGNLEFLGRIDRQVKLRGFRVEPGEIEQALRDSGCVRDAVVEIRTDVEVPHLTAYAVPAAGSSPVAADLREQLKRRLPEYMVPSEFFLVPALPLTANGKIDRHALPAVAARPVAEPANEMFQSDVEEALAKIWREVLGVASVRATDNFFDLGGHSLLAIALFGRIKDQFGRSLPLGMLFERPTVRELAALLPRTPARGVDSTLHLLAATGDKPPLLLMHGVDGTLWNSMRIAKYLGSARPVYGLQTHITDDDAKLTVEAMAAHCVRQIREKVPAGPYHLGGFCAAAKTAVEVAQQLRAQGAEVGQVVIFDYALDAELERTSLGAIFDFFKNLPFWILYDMVAVGPRRMVGRVKSKVRLGSLALKRRFGQGSAETTPDIRDELGMWSYPADQARVLRAIWKAFEDYSLQPYAGRIALFRPRAERLMPWRRAHDLGWGRIAMGGVEVIMVPGSHETMLEEAFVPGVAARLAEVLDRAETAGLDPGDPIRNRSRQ